MNQAQYISKRERAGLLVFAVLPAVFFSSIFVIEGIREYNYSVMDEQITLKNQAENRPNLRFAVHDFVPKAPALFHLFSIFIVLSLIRPQKFIVSTVLTLFYFAFLIFGLYIRVDGETPYGADYPAEVGFFGELYLNTWIWDYVGALFIAIALPWQLSIVSRMAKQSRLGQVHPEK